MAKPTGGLYDPTTYGFWFAGLIREGAFLGPLRDCRLLRLGVRIHDRVCAPKPDWKPCAPLALAFALIPGLIGLAISSVFGKAHLYIQSWAFPLGIVGLAFVLWAMTLGIEHLCADLAHLEEVAIDQTAYRTEVRDTMERGASLRSTGLTIGLILVGQFVVIAVALHHWKLMPMPKKSGPIDFFPGGWRTADARPVAGVVIGVFAVWIAAVFGTAVELLRRNILFVRRLRRLEYAAFPAIVRARLHPFVRTYLFASITWTAGIGLFVLFFVGHYSPLRIALLVVCVIIGVATFTVPYAAMRSILDRSHEKMSDHLARRLVPVGWQPDFPSLDVRDFTAVNNVIAADAPPVLSRRGALAYVTFQLVVVAGLIEKTVVQDVLNLGQEVTSSKSPPKAQPPPRPH